jgi:hypothetical protein
MATVADGLLVPIAVHSLLYVDLCRIFWNMVCAGHVAGMSVQTAYGREGLGHLRGGNRPMDDEGKEIVDPVVRDTTNLLPLISS